MKYKEKAYDLIFQYFQTLHRIGQMPFEKLGKTQFMQGLFPHLPTATRFEVLVCEVLHNLENHKNRLTQFGRQVFKIFEVQDLYRKYYEALYQLERMPFAWFGETVSKEDQIEVTHTICYLEIQKLKQSLACLKQDLETIEAQKNAPKKKMQYIIALFGAKLSFRDISHTYISHYTTDVFEALPLPALTGTYKHFLAVYLAENELTKLPNSGLFAHNLALTLQHYESQKSLTKTIEFEGSLQGGAGKLEIGIYPWKFKFAKYDEWTPVFGVIGVGVQLFSLLRSPASWLSSVLMLVMILTILIGFSRARVYKLNEKKTDNDLDFIQKQETTYFSRENIFDAIAAKVCRDFFAKINFSSFWYHTKKYPTPLDMLKVYPQKWKEIDYMRLDLLRDYKFDMSSKDMLEAQKYVLGLRFLKSFQYFKKVASILIDNRIQTTFYVKMLNIYVTTQGFYGNFWIPSQARNFQHKLKLTQILHTDAPPRPALVGKANEKLADWVTEQTRLLTDTHLAYELQQLEYYVQNYLASPAEKVPFVLDMEELVVFF